MIKNDIPWLVGDEHPMVKHEKKYHRKSHDRYQDMFDKNDPFDQLIMELGQKGVLDVCAVEIAPEPQHPDDSEYSRKPFLHRWRHSS